MEKTSTLMYALPPERVASHITTAEAELETEYQRTKTEAEAFRAFRRKVMDVPTPQPRPDGGTLQQRPLARQEYRVYCRTNLPHRVLADLFL